jgi:hypothetical protein
MMCNGSHINYIMNHVLSVYLPQEQLTWYFGTDGRIELKGTGILIHTEPAFSFAACTLADEDILNLQTILTLLGSSSFDFEQVPKVVNYLKLIHFFTAEFYLDQTVHADDHGRLSSKHIQQAFIPYLEYPIVDILMAALASKIGVKPKTPKHIYFSSDFDFINFPDHKGKTGIVKRYLGNLLKGQLKQLKQEWPSLWRARHDMDYNYFLNQSMFCFETHRNPAVKISNLAFWLVEAAHPKYDYVNDFNRPSTRTFIDKLARQGVVSGLHPNYNTVDQPNALGSQTERFSAIFGYRPKIARFHYLRELPQHKQLNLLDQHGMQEDHSYCFADSLLFRGGRSFAMNLWDFEHDRPSKVLSVPISIMDVTLHDYLKLDEQAAWDACKRKIDLSLRWGSVCSLLWHNVYAYEYGIPHNYQHRLIAKIKAYILQCDWAA